MFAVKEGGKIATAIPPTPIDNNANGEIRIVIDKRMSN
jgi:hypothetical protein